MVRPWKAPTVETILVRPVRRVILNAASFASVPELVKNTLPGASNRPSSFSASAICGAEAKKFETWPRVASCDVTADTTNGCAWPRQFTASPPSRSRYLLPSASHRYAPSPRTSTRFGAPKVFISALRVSRSVAAAFMRCLLERTTVSSSGS